jgi:hypothetical protein
MHFLDIFVFTFSTIIPPGALFLLERNRKEHLSGAAIYPDTPAESSNFMFRILGRFEAPSQTELPATDL